MLLSVNFGNIREGRGIVGGSVEQVASDAGGHQSRVNIVI